MILSSSGLGQQPLTLQTPVRIWVGPPGTDSKKSWVNEGMCGWLTLKLYMFALNWFWVAKEERTGTAPQCGNPHKNSRLEP